MPIELTCECGRRMKAPDSAAGKRAKCPVCGTVLTIPLQPDSVESPPRDDFDVDEWVRSAATPAPTTPPDRTVPPIATGSPAAVPPPPRQVVKVSPASTGGGYVQYGGGTISITATTVPEMKQALKELKHKKKELSLEKRTIGSQLKAIRTAHTQQTRSRGSMVRGGGSLGSIIRFGQRVSRDAARAQLAADLAPLERTIQDVESVILAIDGLILKVEGLILSNGG